MEKAANERRDPAEQVFPIGKPGETQEVRCRWSEKSMKSPGG